VSHGEYALRALLRLENRRDRQTDGRTPDRYITLTIRCGQRIINDEKMKNKLALYGTGSRLFATDVSA